MGEVGEGRCGGGRYKRQRTNKRSAEEPGAVCFQPHEMSLVCRKALVLAFTISGCSSGSLDTGYVDATAKPLAPRLREGDGFPRVSNGKMLIPTFACEYAEPVMS